jgi:RNA polymerase sigma factor (sigma-70 family)
MPKPKDDFVIPEFVPFKDGEEEELIVQAQSGNLQARNTLVERHSRFILSKSKYFKHRRDTIEDAYQNGVIGFMKAIDYWEKSMNCKLITYAAFWIRASVRHRFNRTQLIHIPNHRLSTHDRVNDFAPAEYTDSNNKKHDRMNELPDRSKSVVHRAMINEEITNVREASSHLKDLPRQIIELYLQGLKQREIAKRLAMSHQGISYSFKSAIPVIRRVVKSLQTKR